MVNRKGIVRYVPNRGAAGSDQFTYTITDGQGGTATATVTVQVGPAARDRTLLR
jgi:hypothetical protein